MPCEANDVDEAAVDELFDRIMASGNFSTKQDRAELHVPTDLFCHKTAG